MWSQGQIRSRNVHQKQSRWIIGARFWSLNSVFLHEQKKQNEGKLFSFVNGRWLKLGTVRTYAHLRLLSRSTWVSRYQKGKTNLNFHFTEARDSEWQWHQLGHMQVCTLLQTDNHISTPPLSFFTGWMPFLPPNQQRQSTEGTFVNGTEIKMEMNTTVVKWNKR